MALPLLRSYPVSSLDRAFHCKTLPQSNSLFVGAHSAPRDDSIKILPPTEIRRSKRELGLSILAVLVNGCCSKTCFSAQESELERYTDPAAGFNLLKPSSWIKIDKAGATVLFEEPSKGSNNIGVVA